MAQAACIRCIVLGDPEVGEWSRSRPFFLEKKSDPTRAPRPAGKTCSLLSFVKQKPPTDYSPNTIECYTVPLTLDGAPVSLSLQDTAGS
jgi:hypothetical protein